MAVTPITSRPTGAPAGLTDLLPIARAAAGTSLLKITLAELFALLSTDLIADDSGLATDSPQSLTSALQSAARSEIIIACSDETTALTAGTAKVTFRMPYAFTLTGVRASLSTAQASGNIFTVDINEGGATILSTKLTIDNTEKTSTTAAAAAVISDAALANDAEITIDIDQIGNGSTKGLKVTLLGTRN